MSDYTEFLQDIEGDKGMIAYADFVRQKEHSGSDGGFDPVWLPEFLYPFQRRLVEWAIRRGRAAIFADCGLGKTPMQLVWASNVMRKTGRPVLILTPLAVAHQTEAEARKFGVDIAVSRTGVVSVPITVTNYERLEKFNRNDFAGVVCDESSVLKSFDGVRRKMITEFMRQMPYRLLCTATAAPNDYIELGTSSEALGEIGAVDMLNRFFVNKNKTSDIRAKWRQHSDSGASYWRFKGHAETPFWRWVASWARALRKPSDLGFEDDGFELPPLKLREHIVAALTKREGMLFDLPAVGLREEREELRRTLYERCARVADLVADADCAVAWCHLNAEGDLLERLIPGAVQVTGSEDVDAKEEKLLAFSRGEIRVLVTKPRIGAWGLNWQHCHRAVFFPSHSYEQYYQAVRRMWRFGQRHTVTVDLVTTEGGRAARHGLERKARQADTMFSELVRHMQGVMRLTRDEMDKPVEVPSWA